MNDIDLTWENEDDGLSDLTARVPASASGQRLDKIAALLFEQYSRVELTRWIQGGRLLLDGEPAKPKTRLNGGEQLWLQPTARTDLAWHEPQAQQFGVLYEDEHLLVIDKPAGLVVHPGAGNPSGTLVNGLLFYHPQLAELPRAGLVHRLDKDTSGVMMVAVSAQAQRLLAEAIQQRLVARHYVAVCEGRLVSGLDIDEPIGRDPRTRTRQTVREDGKPALTRIRVRQRYRLHTLVDAQLSTGRTHQIRVHMRHIGHPLVGDTRYGAKGRLPAAPSDELRTAVQQFTRQALHAETLSLKHPISDEPLQFAAPWPADFQQLVDVLGRDDDAY